MDNYDDSIEQQSTFDYERDDGKLLSEANRKDKT